MIIFLSQNGLKDGDALSALLFNFALKCAIRKAQEDQVGLQLNGAHQLLVYADDVSLLGDNKKIKKKNIQKLTDASMEICLEVRNREN
jgi:hypothetical protein